MDSLSINVAFSLVAFSITFLMIPSLSKLFLDAGMFGHDLNKPSRPKIPEAQGVVCGMVFLVILFLFIPIPFVGHLDKLPTFPYDQLSKLLSALISICSMILLGFADDVLDLKWRHKLLFPTLATIPLLMVYLVTYNRTEVIIPKFLHSLIPTKIDLGFFYYLYMGMLAVFCTNSINILAGINGVEVGQSFVIGVSIALNNIFQLYGTCCVDDHMFSLFIILPFLGVTLALLYHNWYPSSVFVGDTYCYFAGMTFAVVGILGHFSKTMLLFFIPQVFNFIYSAPQLFRFVECPRHRMPKYNPETGKLEPSQANIKNIGFLGKLILNIFSLFRLVKITKDKDGNETVNNLTLINLVLLKLGPQNEGKLTEKILLIQILCSLIALFIRYPLASVFYDANN